MVMLSVNAKNALCREREMLPVKVLNLTLQVPQRAVLLLAAGVRFPCGGTERSENFTVRDVSVVVPVHNEERYLTESLSALKKFEVKEVIVILDRCTDGSEAVVRKVLPDAVIIKKDTPKWRNSYAENLQIGLENASGSLVCVHDADIRCDDPRLFDILIGELKGPVASVSPEVRTYKDAGLLNLLVYYWEKTRRIAPFGEKPRGALRLIRRDCLEKVGGFKDVLAPDTQLDLDLARAGYRSKLCKGVYVWHLRELTLGKIVTNQINAGRARREIGQPPWHVLGHAVLRLRPFVLYGYLKGERE
jgi:hypothetical protein